MQVQEMMSQPVETVDPSTTSREAARRMRDENIGALLCRSGRTES
jgi:CBS domain-containing protein